MPTISMFYGIIVRMYCAPGEHNPPHIHVYYNDYRAIYSIKEGDLIDGDFPRNKNKLVLAWIELHREDLLADWSLAQNGELPFKIDPLK